VLTEGHIREMERGRRRVLAPALAAATLLVFAIIGAFAYFRESLTARAGEVAHLALPLAAIGAFLFICMLAERRARRFALHCPECAADISASTPRLLATRRCPACEERVVEGGAARSSAVYERYQSIRSRIFLGNWLWLWPGMGLIAIAWADNDPLAFQRCPQAVWAFPLIGATAGGWSWIRTRDGRYVPPTLTSLAVLCLGTWMYWTRL
jgi:hypothetical protein